MSAEETDALVMVQMEIEAIRRSVNARLDSLAAAVAAKLPEPEPGRYRRRSRKEYRQMLRDN